MTISKVLPVVSTVWLRQQFLKSATTSRGLRIIDTSWLPDPKVDGYNEFYKQSHIETALHFNLWKVSPPSDNPEEKFVIPDSNVFEDYVEHLGISNDTHVVAYDQLNSRPSFRTWFLFRLFGHNKVSVLSGGLRQWIADGNYITTEEITAEPGEFDAKFRPELLRDYKYMVENTKTRAEQVLDARGASGHQAGHIPGAKNIPFVTVFNEDGTVKDLPELKKLFDDAGVDLKAPVVASCGGGLTACALIASAHLLGREDIPLYNGSFTEWSAKSSSDMIESTSS